MGIEVHVAFWRDSAREDWEVAGDLIRAGRTRHGLFFAHLSLEKALKALVTKKTSSVAPRLHNLVRLAELAYLELSEARRDVLAEMNAFNLEGRYPDTLAPPPSRAEAAEYAARCKEVFEWLMNIS